MTHDKRVRGVRVSLAGEMRYRADMGAWRRNAGFMRLAYTMSPPHAGAGVEFVRGSKHCVPSLRYATGTRGKPRLLLALAASPALMIRRCIPQRLAPRPLVKRRGNGERGLKAAGHGLSRILLHVAHCRDGLEEGFQRAWAGGGDDRSGRLGQYSRIGTDQQRPGIAPIVTPFLAALLVTDNPATR